MVVDVVVVVVVIAFVIAVSLLDDSVVTVGRTDAASVDCGLR